jgi:hypothetical protein
VHADRKPAVAVGDLALIHASGLQMQARALPTAAARGAGTRFPGTTAIAARVGDGYACAVSVARFLRQGSAAVRADRGRASAKAICDLARVVARRARTRNAVVQ